MYPDQSQPPVAPTPPPDYLNQIAPQQPKHPNFVIGPKLIALIAGALVIIVIIIAVVINVLVSNARQPLQRLSARLTSTSTVVSGAQGTLKSSQLRSLNSSLSLYLTDINRDISTPLTSAGVDVAKIDDKITAQESSATLTERLEDARLNAIYDRTYAREMAYRLDTLITLMKQIIASTNNSRLKTFLEATYPKLEPTQEAFADFNEAND
jgi:hypothetical protein